MPAAGSLPPLEAVSRVDQATSAIRQAILTGALRPGEPFRASELAARLDTSIIPVREALQRLAGVGLIELRPGRTSVVAALSRDDLRDLYRLRGVLEGEAAQRGVPLLDVGALDAMERDVERMDDLVPSSEDFWAVHHRFHHALLGPALTPRLRHALAPLWAGTERYTRLVFDEVGFDDARPPVDAHRPILDAAHARDGRAARAALLAHYEANLGWMLAGLSRMGLQD